MLHPLLTYAEAAQELGGISVSTVRRLVQEGKLRAHAISTRCHRVDASSVQTYLRDSQIKPQGAAPCRSGNPPPQGLRVQVPFRAPLKIGYPEKLVGFRF